jgi:hypothetical protein
MKVVKLNRKFRQFKEHGHTVGLRFSSYPESVPYETTTKKKLGSGGWVRHDLWYSYFGDRPAGRYQHRPYWITFRNAADATLVVLSTDLTKIG